MNRLFRIYTVCHSVFDFRLKPLFASVNMSKFKDGRVHFRNFGMKGLTSHEGGNSTGGRVTVNKLNECYRQITLY